MWSCLICRSDSIEHLFDMYLVHAVLLRLEMENLSCLMRYQPPVLARTYERETGCWPMIGGWLNEIAICAIAGQASGYLRPAIERTVGDSSGRS